MTARWGTVERRRLVAVTRAVLRASSGSAPGDDRVHRWWSITLHCGHVVERDVAYQPSRGRGKGRQRAREHVLPAPLRPLLGTVHVGP